MESTSALPKDGDLFYSHSLRKNGFLQLYDQDKRFTALPVPGLGYVKDLTWDKRKKAWTDVNDKPN